ncbi:hypothetical protein TA3x_000687 [Tundrisphaera sp. TA3]|uniref:hypothetical protein n=1 Tax=Tundrisphaera sp. TA3 TaxID=3435775 RepID=UPI003EB84480
MSFAPPEEINPFEAPRAGIKAVPVEGVGTDAELTRRAHLGHEASVKSIGSLYYLSALFCGLGLIGNVLQLTGSIGDAPRDPGQMMGLALVCVFSFALLVLTAALGFGLNKLQAWARWTAVVLNALSILYMLGVAAFIALVMPREFAAGGIAVVVVILLITSYILYLLVCAKSGVVFSPAYKQVIAQTPHIKYKTSIIVKIFLGLILGLILLGIIGALLSSGRRG